LAVVLVVLVVEGGRSLVACVCCPPWLHGVVVVVGARGLSCPLLVSLFVVAAGFGC
jgi:hypothetical protein